MKKQLPDQQRDFELIGRFMAFELSEEALKNFEERLENDPVLQERFRLYREMEEQIDQSFPSADRVSVLTDIKDNIKTTQADSTAKIRRMPQRKLLAIAAAVLGLVIVGWWWMNQSTTIDTNLALAEYYWENTDKAHLFESIQRSDGNSTDPNEPARSFFRSIRDLEESGQFNTMIDQLEMYKTTTPSPIPFEDDAEWLLAIAYVGNNNLEKARAALIEIKDRFPARATKAQRLLDAIANLEKGSN